MSATLEDTYNNIHSALTTQLLTVVGLPDKKYWRRENEQFATPPAGTKPGWLAESFQPQPNEQASVGKENRLIRHFGAWFVDLMVPSNTGTKAGKALAGLIVKAFPPGDAVAANGQIVTIRTAYLSGGLQDTEDWYKLPVTITWRADNLTP